MNLEERKLWGGGGKRETADLGEVKYLSRSFGKKKERREKTDLVTRSANPPLFPCHGGRRRERVWERKNHR